MNVGVATAISCQFSKAMFPEDLSFSINDSLHFTSLLITVPSLSPPSSPHSLPPPFPPSLPSLPLSWLLAVLTPADAENHVDKKVFTIPFVCGARDLGEALRRIDEGASMIRTKGEAGTGRWCSSGEGNWESVTLQSKINRDPVF